MREKIYLFSFLEHRVCYRVLWGMRLEESLRIVTVLRWMFPGSPYNSVHSGNICKSVCLKKNKLLCELIQGLCNKNYWFQNFVCQKFRVPYDWWKPMKHVTSLMSTLLGNYFWNLDAVWCISQDKLYYASITNPKSLWFTPL